MGTNQSGQSLRSQSGRQDSNLRPSAPKAPALPSCATPRRDHGKAEQAHQAGAKAGSELSQDNSTSQGANQLQQIAARGRHGDIAVQVPHRQGCCVQQQDDGPNPPSLRQFHGWVRKNEAKQNTFNTPQPDADTSLVWKSGHPGIAWASLHSRIQDPSRLGQEALTTCWGVRA